MGHCFTYKFLGFNAFKSVNNAWLLLSLLSVVFVLLFAISLKFKNNMEVKQVTNYFYRDLIIFVYVLTLFNALAQLTVLFKMNGGYDYNFVHNVILVNENGHVF